MTTPSFLPGDRAKLQEIFQRASRIETRLTRFLEAQGVYTGIQRPFWADGFILAPSPLVTIDAVIRCVPEPWRQKQVRILLSRNYEPLCRIQINESVTLT